MKVRANKWGVWLLFPSSGGRRLWMVGLCYVTTWRPWRRFAFGWAVSLWPFSFSYLDLRDQLRGTGVRLFGKG